MSNKGRTASSPNLLGVGAEVAVTIAGGLLLAGAIAAEQQWWDRHFLPVFFLSHHKYVLGERLARLATGFVGIALILFVRPVMGGWRGGCRHAKSSPALRASFLPLDLRLL